MDVDDNDGLESLVRWTRVSGAVEERMTCKVNIQIQVSMRVI